MRQTIRTRYYLSPLGYDFLSEKRSHLRDSYRDLLVGLENVLPAGMSLSDIYLLGVEKDTLDTLVEHYFVTTDSKRRYKPI